MEVIRRDNEWIVLLVILLMAITLLVMGLQSCSPITQAYRIEFKNGNVEYYELDYKPKKNATSIEYKGDIIFGVQSIERIK